MRWRVWFAVACVLTAATTTAAQEKPPLPEGAVARLGMSRLRVPHTILDSAFSPDQRTFVLVFHATEGTPPNVILFDVATGLERKRLHVHEARRVAMARQKPLMAVLTEQRTELWDLAAEKCLWHRRHPLEAFNRQAIAISPDGAQVVVASSRAGKPGGAILLRWNAADGKELPSLYAANHLIQSVQFSGDGNKLVFLSYPQYSNAGEKPEIVAPGEIITWDVKTGKKIAAFENRHGRVVCSPDATKLARYVKNGEAIEIVNLDGEKPIAKFDVDRTRFAFTPDSKQIISFSAWDHNEIRLWDIAGNREVRTIAGAEWPQTAPPRFAPDGRLFAVELAEAHPYHAVQFRDLATGKHHRFPTGHPGPVDGLAYSSDGRKIATFSKDTLLIYDARTGDELRRWVGETNIKQIAFSPDGTLLASRSRDGAVSLWDSTTAKLKRRLALGAKLRLGSFAFSRDGKALMAAAEVQQVQRWDVATGELQASFRGPDGMTFPRLSPNGAFLSHYLSIGEDRPLEPRIFMLNPQTGKALPAFNLERRHPGDGNDAAHVVISSAVFSSDSKLLATSDYLEFGSGFQRRQPFGHTIRIWETASRREILRLNNSINSHLLAISPDGRTIAHLVKSASIEDVSLIVRDIATANNTIDWKKESRPIRGHHGAITCVAFSPDSKFIATGGNDHVVYVWRVEDFLKRSVVPEPTGDVATLWPHLADADARKAYQAIAQLEQKPKEAVALLRKHLKPVPTADDKVIAQHLRDLSSDNFAVRQQAYSSLEKFGEQAARHLQETLKKPQPIETKRRLESLLERLDRHMDEPDQLRVHRCLVLLERIDTPEARMLLMELSQGAPSAWLSIEARYSLKARQN